MALIRANVKSTVRLVPWACALESQMVVQSIHCAQMTNVAKSPESHSVISILCLASCAQILSHFLSQWDCREPSCTLPRTRIYLLIVSHSGSSSSYCLNSQY